MDPIRVKAKIPALAFVASESGFRKIFSKRRARLAAQAECLDDLLVARLVGIFQIIEEATALGHEHEEPATG